MRTTNRMKLAALAKEFPGLRRLAGYELEDCNHIVIKRADRHEMERIPFQHMVITTETQWAKGDQVFMFDADHNLLGEVTPTQYIVNYQVGGKERFQHGESVLESIFRQQLHRKLHYIIWVVYGVDQLGSFVLPTWMAYIYKPDTEQPVEDTLIDVYHEAEMEVALELEAAGFKQK